MRELIKALTHGLATMAIIPALLSFAVRRMFLGGDRALEGSSQALSVGSSRVDLQACKLEYSIVSPK